MSFEPFTVLRSDYVALSTPDIETDRIIPARFLLTTDRAGLAAGLFDDWRVDENGRPNPRFPLNQVQARGAQILVAGRNFGCGSSREHAAWALVENGFRAVISTGIADIFRANAFKNGLLAIDIDTDRLDVLLDVAFGTLTIDLREQQIAMPDRASAYFEIDPFARRCLLEGMEEIGFLLACDEAIDAFEHAREASI